MISIENKRRVIYGFAYLWLLLLCKSVVESRPYLWARIPNMSQLAFSEDGSKVFILVNCFWSSCGLANTSGQVWNLEDHSLEFETGDWENYDDLPLVSSADERFLSSTNRKACGGGGGDWLCDYCPDSIWTVRVLENIWNSKKHKGYNNVRLDGFQNRSASEYRGVWFENNQIICESQNFTRYIDIYTGQQTRIVLRQWELKNVLLSPDRSILYSNLYDQNHTDFYDAKTEKLLWTWKNYCDRFKFSSNGLIVWGFENNCAIGRNVHTGEEIWRVRGIQSNAFAITPDEKSLWEIRDEKEIWIWPLV